MTAGLPAHNVTALLLLGFVGALVYGGAILGLFGKAWLASFWRAYPSPERGGSDR